MRADLTITAALAAMSAGGQALASGRAEALAGAFQHWCLQEPPSFELLDAKATAAHLVVQTADRTDTPATGLVETKIWEVTDEPTGPYDLSDGSASNGQKTVTLCEIAAPDARGDDLRDLLSQTGWLGPPVDTRNSDDGVQRITEFKAPFAGSTILLSDGAPQGAAGVMLNITEVREPGR